MKNLNELVKQEADNIKLHATELEKSKLLLVRLNPESKRECVYGLMTGNCFSDRASELLNLCAMECVDDIEDVFEIIGKVKYSATRNFFSPLEYYINQKDADNRQLIKYIKGQTDTLTL